MKQCPNCQKTFDDEKRFCQIDGTPLVDMVENVQSEDPFKTVVVGKQDIASAIPTDDPMKTMVVSSEPKEEDILQIPDVFDPMKTMVVSEPIKYDKPVATPPVNEPVVPTPEPPKFSEPSLSPPSFGDLSANEPPKIDQPISNPFSEPPKADIPIANPFSEPPKIDSPFSTPMGDPPKPFETPNFGSTPLPSESSSNSPFGAPINDPIPSPFEATPVSPPPYKEPEPAFNVPPSPFDATPFGQNEPVNQPFQQDNWSPPPAPMQGWQDQGLGAETPFQPPVAGVEGQNKTMATISLVLGILSCLCCFSIITGPVALIMGFLARGNISKDPAQYGGGSFALWGMITGAIGTLIGIAAIALQLLGAFAGRF